MTYAPGGKRHIKTPRACPMLWRTAEGKFLFWFHNNGSREFRSRNPVWISGGVEKDGKIHWSQPEILLYDPDLAKGMSYPDLIEQDGRYWVTETQKTEARVHEVDRTLLEGLWTQGEAKAIAREGLLADQRRPEPNAAPLRLPAPLDLRTQPGFSLELWVRFDDLAPGQVLLDSRTPEGKGLALATTANGTLEIQLSDGTQKAAWDCDPGLLSAGRLHHVVAIVDAGPKTISFVVDGALCDGGEARPFGWTRFPADLADTSGTGSLRVAPSLHGRIERVRVYGRYLRTSEAVAHFHAGRLGTR